LEIQVFNNSEFGSVRTAVINDEPFFVGKDVAEVLGYENQNRDIVRHVEEEDRMMLDGKTQYQNGIELGQRGGWLINESGLFSLILSSKLPTARRFKRWVTGEVLPAIRKHGVYAVENLLDDPDAIITALQAYKAERQKRMALETVVENNKLLIEEMKPKADYCKAVLDSPDPVAITLIAKDYGWSAKKMNQYLHEHDVQYRQGDTWVLYAAYAGFGYTKSKTSTFISSDGVGHAKIRTYWTQKGRMFIYNLLKEDNILPVMERV